MHERVRLLRKHLNLTLDAFGQRIGITMAAVSNIENGRSNPSNQVVLSICREFHVNEHWLRTGEGEMMEQINEDQDLAEWMGELLHDCPDSFRRRFISVVSKLDTKGWEVLEQIADELAASKPEEE